MGFGIAIVQAAFEYGAANGIMAELTRVGQDISRFARDHWVAVAIGVVVLFLITRPFRSPS